MTNYDHAPDWIPTQGRNPGLPEGTLVDVMFLDGYIENGRSADLWLWGQDGEPDDITHYRIHQPEPAVPSVSVLVEALEQIKAIEDELEGGDWDEIEKARNIARNALAAYRKGDEP